MLLRTENAISKFASVQTKVKRPFFLSIGERVTSAGTKDGVGGEIDVKAASRLAGILECHVLSECFIGMPKEVPLL